MKKRKLLLSTILLLLIFGLVYFGEELFLKVKVIYNCWDCYNELYSLKDVYVDNEENKISVSFKREVEGGNEIISISRLYNSLYEMIYSDSEEKYNSYTFTLNFRLPSKKTYIAIKNISKTKDSIEIIISDGNISISDISSMCPEVSHIVIGNAKCESLKEFDGFIDLKCISFIGMYADAEVESYILSKFPDCEISWKEE